MWIHGDQTGKSNDDSTPKSKVFQSATDTHLSAGDAAVAGLAAAGHCADPQRRVPAAVALRVAEALVPVVSGVDDPVERLLGDHVDDHVAALAAGGHARVELLRLRLLPMRKAISFSACFMYQTVHQLLHQPINQL